MYTNELLEEKYKAQRELSEKAKTDKKDYFEMIKMEVQDLFHQQGWKLLFDKRIGSFKKN